MLGFSLIEFLISGFEFLCLGLIAFSCLCFFYTYFVSRVWVGLRKGMSVAWSENWVLKSQQMKGDRGGGGSG